MGYGGTENGERRTDGERTENGRTHDLFIVIRLSLVGVCWS